jgi:hypothetical protein
VDKSVDASTLRRKLGHWLDQGTSMIYVILPKSCIPIVRTLVFPVSENWRLNPEYHAELKELDESIQAKIGDKLTDNEVEEVLLGVLPIPDEIIELFDGEDPTVKPVEGKEFRPEADKFSSPEVFDQYLMVNILLDHGGEAQLRTVKQRKRNHDGNFIGHSHPNPLLDMREYEVEFLDGSIDVLTANVIAEVMYICKLMNKARVMLFYLRLLITRRMVQL